MRIPMLVTLLPMVTLVRPVQSRNAFAPMLVTLSGMVTLVRPVQLANALYPMLVTLIGNGEITASSRGSNQHSAILVEQQ